MGGYFIIILFLILLLCGVRISLSLGLSSLIYITIFLPNVNLATIAQRMFTAVDSTSLLAIPFFILAGELMNSGGISRRMVNFAMTIVGHIRSGLSLVSVLACMFFGGVTGSAIADTAAIGSTVIPEMSKKGYDRSYSAALLASAGCIGPIIPPSIPMVVYSSIAGVSVSKMFLGGYVPGILCALVLMVVCYIVGLRNNHPREERATMRQRWETFKDSILSLVTPIIIMGGIVCGIVTPTEAGVLGAAYALIVGVFIYKEVTFAELPKILLETVVVSGIVILVMSTAAVFGWVLAYERVPQMVASGFQAISTDPTLVLMMIMGVMIITGMFIDGTAALVIMTPVFLPIVMALHIDLVFFGVLMAINICIGCITPPVGVCLYTSAGIAKVSLEEVSRAVIPFIVAYLVLLAIFVIFPQIILVLPNSF